MKKILGLAGVAAACGVCCAFPLVLPWLGSLAASGLGLGFAFGWKAAALAGVAALAAMVLFVPAVAAEFASTLTSHFLGKPALQSGCTKSCGCRPGATA